MTRWTEKDQERFEKAVQVARDAANTLDNLRAYGLAGLPDVEVVRQLKNQIDHGFDALVLAKELASAGALLAEGDLERQAAAEGEQPKRLELVAA